MRAPPPGLSVLVEALTLFGDITVPLSLCVTGAQLAELLAAGDLRLPQLARVTAGRLLVVPALALALLLAVEAVGAHLDAQTRTVLLIIVAMPVAISGSIFAQRFDGDVPLAARAVLLSTLLSLVTVPALLWIAA